MPDTVSVSVKILPFGSISFELGGGEVPVPANKPSMPRYVIPGSTCAESMDVRLQHEGGYVVPETTA